MCFLLLWYTCRFSFYYSAVTSTDLITCNAICFQSCRIVAKLATYGKERMNSSDLKFFFNWIRNQLTTQNNEYIQTVAMCLQQMLKYNEYRVGFMANDGVSTYEVYFVFTVSLLIFTVSLLICTVFVTYFHRFCYLFKIRKFGESSRTAIFM